MAALDDFGTKHNTLERQLDEDLSLIQLGLEKLLRTQIQQVSKLF
jgi:hypothetical protein